MKKMWLLFVFLAFALTACNNNGTEYLPREGTERLMILQANTHGNNNGLTQNPPAPTGGGFRYSVVELFNNTGSPIDLTAGNYSLHIGGSAGWSTVIALEGTAPAGSSWLVIGTRNWNTSTPRADLPAADQQADFEIPNNNFKVALMRNHSVQLEGNFNPLDHDDLKNYVVDLLGAFNDDDPPDIGAYKGFPALQSRPQPPRRRSLVDSGANLFDFVQSDLRGRTGTRGIPDEFLYRLWPRNSAAGPWNPVTGLPRVDPVVVPHVPD